MLTDFHNTFTDRFNSKFVTKFLLTIPSHLNCVTTLPCEISVFGHNRHWPKSGEGLLWGRLGSTGCHLAQCGLGPQFSAHVYCSQTAGWIKMPLGTKVGLSPCDSVLDGDPAPSPQRGWSPSPIFGPFLLWPNGCMHQDATWYAGRPQPTGLCVRWAQPPKFSAHIYYSYCDFVRTLHNAQAFGLFKFKFKF